MLTLNNKARRAARRAFTLIEIMIVVVILAVLASTVVPQYKEVTTDAKLNTTVFNLQGLRAQIELYRAQHGGQVPPNLDHLTIKTDAQGNVGGDLGPYIVQVPEDNLHGTNAVVVVVDDPITVTGTAGGWIYSSTSGEIRVNHTDHASL